MGRFLRPDGSSEQVERGRGEFQRAPRGCEENNMKYVLFTLCFNNIRTKNNRDIHGLQYILKWSKGFYTDTFNIYWGEKKTSKNRKILYIYIKRQDKSFYFPTQASQRLWDVTPSSGVMVSFPPLKSFPTFPMTSASPRGTRRTTWWRRVCHCTGGDAEICVCVCGGI